MTPPNPENEVYHCYFDNKKTFEDLTPNSKTDFWQFEEMVCYSGKSELIENASTGAEFYIAKTINYGDSLIIFFLLLFAIFGIIKLISEWFIPKKIDFRK